MDKYICFLLGHKYFVAQELTPTARRICCKRCSKSFAMNDEVKCLLDWDSEFHKLYEVYNIEIEYIPFEFSLVNDSIFNTKLNIIK